MNMTRRSVIQSMSAFGALVAMGLLSQSQALAAAGRPGFDEKNLNDALKAIGGNIAESKDINLVSPDIAENCAVVPVTVTSAIPNTEQIYIFVEKNPNPLSASFTIPAGTEASVQTRVKMGESSNVIALVKADGKLYRASRETKVTLGGCGG